MRRRMLITYVTLLTIVLVGLTVPLGITVASRDTQTMLIDRVNDTARFASLAEPALRTGRTSALQAQLRLYERLFGIGVVILGRDGTPVLTSSDGLPITEGEVQARADAALSGQRSGVNEMVWPWNSHPLVVAEPIGSGGEIIGAALTLSPVSKLTESTWRQWAFLAGMSILVLAVGTVAARPLTRWMIRPVHDLDHAAHALTDGRLSERAPVASGPPELRRLAASFNTMADQLATLIERQRTFVSYASHQLRTPLATLRISVDNLAPYVSHDGADNQQLVTEEIDRLSQICDSLLAFARAEATAAEVDQINVVPMVAARVAAWRPVAAQAGIRLHGRAGGTAVALAARSVIDQALDALIDNAVKFAGPGTRIMVAVRPRYPGWVDINVIDNGPGIPPEDLERAAEPFWRRPSHQNIVGSGLGVAIAKALVTAAGGQLELRPAHPHGVDACIRLPAAAAASDGAHGPSRQEPHPDALVQTAEEKAR